MLGLIGGSKKRLQKEHNQHSIIQRKVFPVKPLGLNEVQYDLGKFGKVFKEQPAITIIVNLLRKVQHIKMLHNYVIQMKLKLYNTY